MSAAKNKEIIEKVNAAFEQNKPEEFLNYCSEDIRWEMAGDQVHNGKKSIREFMSSAQGMEPPKFTFDAIIAEDDRVACYGKMTMKENGVESTYSYCDVYTLANDLITELRSFVVKHKSEGETDQAASA